MKHAIRCEVDAMVQNPDLVIKIVMHTRGVQNVGFQGQERHYCSAMTYRRIVFRGTK
jgi:hypothetical protein